MEERYKPFPSLDVTKDPIWTEKYQTTNDWHDLPVDFVLWKQATYEERKALDSIVAQLDDAACDEVLDYEVKNRYTSEGYRTRSRRMRLGIRLTSRSYPIWEIIFSIVGLTADDLAKSDAAFAAAEFSLTAWKAARERAASDGHALEVAIGTETASVLTALRWILGNDSALAEELRERVWLDISGMDH